MISNIFISALLAGPVAAAALYPRADPSTITVYVSELKTAYAYAPIETTTIYADAPSPTFGNSTTAVAKTTTHSSPATPSKAPLSVFPTTVSGLSVAPYGAQPSSSSEPTTSTPIAIITSSSKTSPPAIIITPVILTTESGSATFVPFTSAAGSYTGPYSSEPSSHSSEAPKPSSTGSSYHDMTSFGQGASSTPTTEHVIPHSTSKPSEAPKPTTTSIKGAVTDPYPLPTSTSKSEEAPKPTTTSIEGAVTDPYPYPTKPAPSSSSKAEPTTTKASGGEGEIYPYPKGASHTTSHESHTKTKTADSAATSSDYCPYPGQKC